MGKLFHSSQRDSCAIHKRIFRALSFNKSAEKALFLPVLLVRNQVERPRALLPDSLTHSRGTFWEPTFVLGTTAVLKIRGKWTVSITKDLTRASRGFPNGHRWTAPKLNGVERQKELSGDCVEKAKSGTDEHSTSCPLLCLPWLPSTKPGWRKMPKMMAFQLGIKDASEPAAGGRLYTHSYSRDMELNPKALVLGKHQLTVA